MWTLIIWTVVGYAVTPSGSHYAERDWRPVAEIKSEEACHKAARQLGYIDNKKYRCISPV